MRIWRSHENPLKIPPFPIWFSPPKFFRHCQVRKLQEDFPDDFPNRLAMSILDEAAATAETYVPLVISGSEGEL